MAEHRLVPFAIVPAAGRSERMGVPKLLLDVGGQTVIARVLAALAAGGIANRLVVVNPHDTALPAAIERAGGRVVVPAASPKDMKASVRYGLRAVADALESCGQSAEPDAPWFLIPADHPVLYAEIVQALLDAAAKNPGRIVVPTYRGRRGHPTVFAWKHAAAIEDVPDAEGVNWVLKRHAAEVIEIAVASEGVLIDLDTPADYERLRSLWAN